MNKVRRKIKYFQHVKLKNYPSQISFINLVMIEYTILQISLSYYQNSC